jgi:hypothetical protein
MKRAILALLCALAATPVLAQTKEKIVPAPKPSAVALPCDPLNLLPGCVSAAGVTNNAGNSGDLWAKIVAASIPDLTYAQALANAAATPGSKLRAACYSALLIANQQASGANLVGPDGKPLTKPSPAVVTMLEQGAEVLDDLQATAPVMAACAPAANAAAQSVTQLLNTLLAGIAVKAAIPALP